jgi:hypothetical protein
LEFSPPPASSFHLQRELDQEEEKQIITSMISAKYKRDDTVKATEATAIAIYDVSPQGQSNMEQHIKNLIERALKEKEKEKIPPPPSSNKNEKTPQAARHPNLHCQETKGKHQRKYHSNTQS